MGFIKDCRAPTNGAGTRNDRRKILILFFLILSLVDISAAHARGRKDGRPDRLNGTFIQLTSEHLSWERGQWEELFSYFRDMGLTDLVVQWSVYDEVRFYPAGTEAVSPLETVLRLADDYGMEVTVGLAMDSKYWQSIEEEPLQVKAYLDEVLDISEQTAAAVFPIANSYASFAGWYIPQEVDHVNWMDEEPQEALFGFMRELSAYLRGLAPEKSISLSGFSSTRICPGVLKDFWGKLLTASDVDRVLFQDGIGTGMVDLNNLSAFCRVMRKAASAAGREFYVVIEVFRQEAGAPVNDEPFRAVPADWDRIQRQLETAGRYADGLIAFSVPEYMTPLGGEAAAGLYRDYIDYLRRGRQRFLKNHNSH